MRLFANSFLVIGYISPKYTEEESSALERLWGIDYVGTLEDPFPITEGKCVPLLEKHNFEQINYFLPVQNK